MNKQTIYITGTPCTGKTTITKELEKTLKCQTIHLNHILKTQPELTQGKDQEKGYIIADIPLLCQHLQKIIQKNTLTIVESHLSHLCKNADKIIILRVHPNKLEERLKKRNYNEKKIQENLEAEALGVCTIETYENYPQNSYEIDITNQELEETIKQIKSIINSQTPPVIGEIDFTDWLIK